MEELRESDYKELLKEWERTEDERRINFTKSVNGKLVLISVIRSVGKDEIDDIEVSHDISNFRLHWFKICNRISAKDFIKLIINNGWEEHRFFYQNTHYKTRFFLNREINGRTESLIADDTIIDKGVKWDNLVYFLADKGLMFKADVKKEIFRVKM